MKPETPTTRGEQAHPNAPRNPLQRLAFPEASSGIQPGWTLGLAPQARASSPPSYLTELDNSRPLLFEPTPTTNTDRLVRRGIDITSQTQPNPTSAGLFNIPSTPPPITIIYNLGLRPTLLKLANLAWS